MSGATVEEYIELLNAEQHVDLPKLRAYARHGVQPSVRGEVWLYLLGVLSSDKSQEMTSVRSKFLEYEGMHNKNPFIHKSIHTESEKFYKTRLAWRPPPDRRLVKSSHKIAARSKLHHEHTGAQMAKPALQTGKQLYITQGSHVSDGGDNLVKPIHAPADSAAGPPTPLTAPTVLQDHPLAKTLEMSGARFFNSSGRSAVTPVDLDAGEEDQHRFHHPYQHIITDPEFDRWPKYTSEADTDAVAEPSRQCARASSSPSVAYPPRSPTAAAGLSLASASASSTAAAAASEEIKQRFCDNVDNVVCAFLNRMAWKLQLAHEKRMRLEQELASGGNQSQGRPAAATPPRDRSDSASSKTSLQGGSLRLGGDNGRDHLRRPEQMSELSARTPVTAHRQQALQSHLRSRSSSMSPSSYGPSLSCSQPQQHSHDMAQDAKEQKERFNAQASLIGGSSFDSDRARGANDELEHETGNSTLAEREGDDMDLDWSIQRTTPHTPATSAFQHHKHRLQQSSQTQAHEPEHQRSESRSSTSDPLLNGREYEVGNGRGSMLGGTIQRGRANMQHDDFTALPRFFHVAVRPHDSPQEKGNDNAAGGAATSAAPEQLVPPVQRAHARQQEQHLLTEQQQERYMAVAYPVQFHPALVYLCVPFVQCMKVEASMYFAFEKLMSLIEEHNKRVPLASRIATFLTLFRATLPELFAYFDEEEVDVVGFASKWLQNLLAKEMRMPDLMRLWDTYFAMPDFLDLHLYVCIAILMNSRDPLEELDQSETKSMLSSLPPLDVDQIINDAINIRLSHQQSQVDV
ncbi:hypothetical protein K437DRAFT_253880 [Tilletiaria anomala UBC 951]|uniref:Rab-GAP TBC domain-containing protein n=1 Tax=Tilletiaria anomala (strain ATCC 24038 / CBS 436.72 / UBC 951) TaxID=1037660 RepID=A0A066WPY0_TILAU|nr:uncharacterized protein K437DRAFT_253880 [Tilletiaria anomala UBC 951]KDN52685.1 hypothetical protein K437DRAFT_253880 [Tilletiaria anomala UBC 951]